MVYNDKKLYVCLIRESPISSNLFFLSWERRKVSKNKKRKKRLNLQAQLLDVILEMQNEAERRDEIHNLERILRDFRGIVSAPEKKMRNYYWEDMVFGFEVLLNMSKREDEIHNIGKLIKVTKKLQKL